MCNLKNYYFLFFLCFFSIFQIDTSKLNEADALWQKLAAAIRKEQEQKQMISRMEEWLISAFFVSLQKIEKFSIIFIRIFTIFIFEFCLIFCFKIVQEIRISLSWLCRNRRRLCSSGSIPWWIDRFVLFFFHFSKKFWSEKS